VLLVLQVMTGILLALVYETSPATREQPSVSRSQCEAGMVSARDAWLGSDFMIAVVLIHMAQVFLLELINFRGADMIIGCFCF